MSTSPAVTKAWRDLHQHGADMAGIPMRDLFAQDPARATRYFLEADGIALDYSKNNITEKSLDLLLALAAATGIEQKRDALFAGEKINRSENRAVLHVALRDHKSGRYRVDGRDVMADISAERDKMALFCANIHANHHLGVTGKPLRHVVNIGIGGSDLGPKMVCQALKPYWLPGRRVDFVANVDGAAISQTLAGLDWQETLFLVASKTFTTQETMANAKTARQWFLQQGGREQDIAKHFVALSTNEQAVQAFGIAPESMFRFWDWVGGRFSLWSSIGLSIALTVGFDRFEELLAGAHAMDGHFKTKPLGLNMPVIMALMGVWNRNIMGAAAHAILPYDQTLALLPDFLQQLDMESNGKGVAIDGREMTEKTGPVIFGAAGTNGQHAFYQLIHQGTDLISADFIAPARSHYPQGDHHKILLANFLAQPQALMQGKNLAMVKAEMAATGVAPEIIKEVAPQKTFPGNRPSNALIVEMFNPFNLGALIALYEHKIFCQGVLWGINSFDQWGVELGKQLAGDILPALSGGPAPALDSSTANLLARLNQWGEKQ